MMKVITSNFDPLVKLLCALKTLCKGYWASAASVSSQQIRTRVGEKRPIKTKQGRASVGFCCSLNKISRCHVSGKYFKILGHSTKTL